MTSRLAPQRPAACEAAVDWRTLSHAYHRLALALRARPAAPPIGELDAFSVLAARSRLSPQELVALHYATLNQLLAGDERYACESAAEARLTLVSVLLHLMGKNRRAKEAAPAHGPTATPYK
jgi:hypothetical protein